MLLSKQNAASFSFDQIMLQEVSGARIIYKQSFEDFKFRSNDVTALTPEVMFIYHSPN